MRGSKWLTGKLSDVTPGDRAVLADGSVVKVRWHMGPVTFVGDDHEQPRKLAGDTSVVEIRPRVRTTQSVGGDADPLTGGKR